MRRNYPVFRSFSHIFVLSGLILGLFNVNAQSRESAATFLARGRELAQDAKYDSSLIFLGRSLQAFTSSKDSTGVADSYYETALVYALKSKYKEAIAAQQKAFVLYQKTGNYSSAINSLLSLGYSSFKLKKYPDAKQFYKQALERAQRNSAFEQMVEAYDGLANVYEAQKDYRNAISSVRFMQGAYDSIVIRDHRKEMDSLEERYSTLLEEKDSQLVVAESQHRQVRTQGLLHAIEREDIRLTFYSVALALTFVVLCLVALWFVTRRTARTAERDLRREQSVTKTANEQFEIISRQVHDELTSGLNDMSFSTSQLATLRAHDEIASAALHVKAMGELLIGNMMDLMWLINPNNRSLESLIAYIRDQTNNYLKPTGINYMIVMPDRMPNAQLTSLERLNLFMVTRELIRYAIETSKAKGITLTLTIEGRQLIFKVKDSTMPVDEAKAKKRGDELAPLREKMEQIDGTIGLVMEQGAMVVIYRKDLA
jgi:hypothetical protein